MKGVAPDLFSRLVPLVESSLTVGFVIAGVVVGFMLLGRVTKDIGKSFMGSKMNEQSPMSIIDTETVALIRYRLGVIEEEVKVLTSRLGRINIEEISRRLNVIDGDIRRLEDALIGRQTEK